MNHYPRVALWLTPPEDDDLDAPSSPMTVAEAALSLRGASVWADGRFLQQSTWALSDERVLPRVGDLVVSLYRAALGDYVGLLEVVLNSDSRDHLQSAPAPDCVSQGSSGLATAVYLVDLQSDELRYWLDMMLGLGYAWSLSIPEPPLEHLSSIEESQLHHALRDPAVCVTEHDGEIVQVSVRDEVAAKTVLHRLEQVARELGYVVTEGP